MAAKLTDSLPADGMAPPPVPLVRPSTCTSKN
jgi:hypothetical protein